ncbi:putative protein N(5)-glutamine methyltransferase [Agromyces sp. CFH 90414]|uniref:peptide chain release factor N(5)-glutamine methyltransferase n=1 Tax=Agromyces agglutinans TaxID=2662258 RepID=A0A6I2FEK5_9MICO|nr:putative protein N(5)-glutamine methyltransferase [Agromyces agglutinans]MRG60956.1 putative protein N(5)-glutamine methyltransferase [Agromyces agglutinans]
MTGADALVARLRAAGCVFAEEEAALLRAAAADPDALERLVARRVAGEPLEPLLGWVEFAGLRLEVGPGVFVPRRRTEALAAAAAESARAASRRVDAPVVVDLCCGVGAIAAVVAASVPAAWVVAADLDPVAVGYAARNLAAYGGRAYAGDLYAALPVELVGSVDVLAVNAPYVPSAEIELMPREARDHEPRHTLDGGDDGLGLHRRIAADAPRWLAQGGCVLIETSERQAPSTAAVLRAAGLAVRIEGDEEVGSTYVVGVRAGRAF